MEYIEVNSRMNPDNFRRAMRDVFSAKSFIGPVKGRKGNYATLTENYNVGDDLVIKYEATDSIGCGDPDFSRPHTVTIEVSSADKVKKEETERKLSEYLFSIPRSL